MKYKIFKSHWFQFETLGEWRETSTIFIGVQIEITSTGRILVKQNNGVIAIFSKEYSVINLSL